MSNYPPYDISPENLWSQIIETPRPIIHINFPRLDEHQNPVDRLTLMVLTKEDFHRSQMNINEYVTNLLTKNKLTDNDSDLISKIKTARYNHEILFRCCRKYNDITRPFFPTIDDIGQLYSEEIDILLSTFLKFQGKFNPIGLNEREMEEWIRILTIGGSYFLRFHLIGANENINEVFGIPTSQLTEGQILAWVAARKHYLDKEKYEK